MVCRLCLQNSSEVLEIFNNKGKELEIAMLIGKHFWFEPKNEDPVSSHVCHCCWTKLSDFHEFYKYVEKAQQLLTVDVIVKTEYNFTVCDVTVEDVKLERKYELEENLEEQYEEPFNITSDFTVCDVTVEDVKLESKYELEENIEEQYEETFNTSDMLAEDNYGAVEFEFPPDSKDQFIGIVNNEINKDDQDISEIHDDTGDESDLQFQIKEKKRILRKKGTKMRRSAKRNKVELLTEETTTTLKGHGRPRKGEVAPLKNKSISNERKAAKGTYVMTKEMSEMVNRKISEYMQLKCDVCGIEFDTFGHIITHMRSVHDVRPYVKCCEKKFITRASLYHHIKFHLNPDIYKCEKCDKVFSDKRNFTNHNIQMHESEDTKIFQCPQCPKKYARKYLLQNHITWRHNKKYFTKESNQGFHFMSGLTPHTVLGHVTKGDVSSEVVEGPVAFKRDQFETKVQCEFCYSWHKNKTSLTRHKRRHKYQEQPQVCNVCQKTCPNRRALYVHKRNVHDSDSKHECNICKKKYKSAKSLKEHMSKHTGLSLYRCLHCTQTFKHISNMHFHRKHMHPKEFEELRKLRNIIPTISSLSDATKSSDELVPFSST